MTDEDGKERGLGKGYLWFGGLFFLFFLFLYFPASLAYPLVVRYVPGWGQAVVLSGLEGTWLSGSAREGLIDGVPVRQVRWAAKPWGTADLAFRSGKDGYAAGRVEVRPNGRLTVTNLRARLPLALLHEMLRGKAPEIEGLATAALKRLEFAGGRLQAAEGTLVCSGVRLVRPRNLVLGDFKIKLTTAGDEIKAAITDSGGPLAMHGLLLLRTDGSYSFSGSAAARRRDLASIVRLLGKPGADGMVTINRQGMI